MHTLYAYIMSPSLTINNMNEMSNENLCNISSTSVSINNAMERIREKRNPDSKTKLESLTAQTTRQS